MTDTPMTDTPIRRSLAGGGWEHVETLRYKDPDAAPYRSITRRVLFGEDDLHCELRYFEIAPGGWSTLERHEHAHAVMVLRGHGRCLVGDAVHRIGEHDLVRVPPKAWHQFRADDDTPLGFLCLVNRERDRPQLPNDEELASLRRIPSVDAFIRTGQDTGETPDA